MIAGLRPKLRKERARRGKAKGGLQTAKRGASPDRAHELQNLVLDLTKERNLVGPLHMFLLKEQAISEVNIMSGVHAPPMPSSDLLFHFGGQRSFWIFLSIGKKIAAHLTRLVGEVGRNIDDFRYLLDFVAGCGRVLKRLPGIFTSARLHAAEVDAEAIEWCRSHPPLLTSATNLPLHPPSLTQEAHSDFIFAIFVFIHLPIAVQTAWFAELRSLSRPRALLILSCMPDTVASEHCAPDAALEDLDRFSYYETTPTEGLTDYDHVGYHTEDAIRRLAGEDFTVPFARHQGINAHQSAVVCEV